MSGFLLDTNICIHLINGQFNLAAKIDEVGLTNCFLSRITIAELLYGIANSSPARQPGNRQNLAELQQLFSGRILTFESALETYAVQKAHLKSIGRLQGDFDLLIGSTALAHGLTLVTRNTRHFADLANLPLANWIDTPQRPYPLLADPTRPPAAPAAEETAASAPR